LNDEYYGLNVTYFKPYSFLVSELPEHRHPGYPIQGSGAVPQITRIHTNHSMHTYWNFGKIDELMPLF